MNHPCFLRINLPLLGGLSATRLIRGMAEMCDVVIVAFSAFSSGDNRAGALAAGCNEYMMKPIDFDRLSQVVERHLSTG